MANTTNKSAVNPLDTIGTPTDVVQRSGSAAIISPPLRLTTAAVDSLAVVVPSLALISKAMSASSQQARLSAMSSRVRKKSKKIIEDALLRVFNFPSGTLSFDFPSDATSGESIGAWLTEGDLVSFASPAEEFFISVDEPGNIPVIESTVLAKFRLNATRKIHNVFAIEDPIFAKKVPAAEAVLTLILQNIDFSVHREVEPMNKTLTVDEAYAAFMTAATELSNPITHQVITDIIKRDTVS
ncbi:hypothetical protein [Janthinobacterium lividum]|uniref:hypothetical protein n=1 Tax=Janthinobacterium lividum TaxID=29581 RepID=UPI000AA85B04|nr:hypothetical protein [Janthinobacterium lividum]